MWTNYICSKETVAQGSPSWRSISSVLKMEQKEMDKKKDFQEAIKYECKQLTSNMLSYSLFSCGGSGLSAAQPFLFAC